MNYEPLMKRAIRLARKAEGHTGHYPMVGAVLLKNNQVIAEGYFKHPGEPHAERQSHPGSGKKRTGPTLILNLKPCCHFGRTPPCTDMVISSGIKKVVAGMTDPNPLVSGKGFRKLQGRRD